MPVRIIPVAPILALTFLAVYPPTLQDQGIGTGPRESFQDNTYISSNELSGLENHVAKKKLGPSVTSTAYVGCTCSTPYCSLDCFDRPQFLASGRCYKIATQGPCPRGEVLIPVNLNSAKCGPDACHHKEPTNAINFSILSSSGWQWEEIVFKFTYNNKCYITETEAFCGRGKVVRFRNPYKIPLCVPRHYTGCEFKTVPVPPSVSTNIWIPCRPDYVRDPIRHTCVQGTSNLG